MAESFHIQFAYNGTYFKGEVFPLENDTYRVEYKISGLELKPKIVFIKKEIIAGNAGYSWQSVNDQSSLDDEFIDAIGREVDASMQM